MYRSAVILIVTAVLAVIVLLVAAQALAVVEMLAVVDERVGSVHVVRGSQAQAATVGMLVRAGDRVRTGANALVGLHWADGTRLEVGPETELVVQRCRANRVRKVSSTHFRLNLGEVWIRLRGALHPGSKFEVETPTIVAAVRGTIFGVKVSPDGTSRLEVYEGEVDILDDHGQSMEAGVSGECAVVGKGRFQVQRMTPAEAERWESKADIIGPLVDVAEPGHSVTTTSVALVPVSGRTEDMTVITVNGERVKVSPKGLFRSRARLTEGSNVITVVGTLGRLRTSVERRVTYVNPTQVIALTAHPSTDPRDAPGVMEITAVLRGSHSKLVPDGTPVEFSADRGIMPRYSRTDRGAVTAKWNPQAHGEAARVTAKSGQATAIIVVPPAKQRGAAAEQAPAR
jgi:hypothetical protein